MQGMQLHGDRGLTDKFGKSALIKFAVISLISRPYILIWTPIVGVNCRFNHSVAEFGVGEKM